MIMYQAEAKAAMVLHPLELSTGWTAYNAVYDQAATYRRTMDGIVHLADLVAGPVSGEEQPHCYVTCW